MSTHTVDVDKILGWSYLYLMTPEQCRAARGWLDISQQALADKSGVSLSTVRDFEKGRRVPIGNNLSAMQRALEAMGIALQNGGITGPAT